MPKFAERTDTLGYLDIAVLNAGLFKADKIINKNTGFEEDVQVNSLSKALLALLLLPVIKAKKSSSTPGRITIVSSDTASWAKIPERKSDPLLPAFKDTAAE